MLNSNPSAASGLQGLMDELSRNVGQNLKPGTSAGAAVQPPLPSYGFDPMTYGQTGGEATFYGQGVNGGMAPLTALGSLGSAGKFNNSKPVDVSALLAMIKKLLGNKRVVAERPFDGGGRAL